MKSLSANGHQIGPARAEAGATDAAGAQPEQGLADLEAALLEADGLLASVHFCSGSIHVSTRSRTCEKSW